jgi:hypothetical protein
VAKKRSAENQGLMKSRHDTLVAARESTGPAANQEGALADFAGDLGRLLGTAERKAATWLDQRKTVAEQLAAIRDKASDLLSQLGGSGGAAASALVPGPRRRGRRAATKRAAGGPRKRRRMSAEARERIAEAQRQRWAKVRKAKGAA